jgi:hypothetical protein
MNINNGTPVRPYLVTRTSPANQEWFVRRKGHSGVSNSSDFEPTRKRKADVDLDGPLSKRICTKNTNPLKESATALAKGLQEASNSSDSTPSSKTSQTSGAVSSEVSGHPSPATSPVDLKTKVTDVPDANSGEESGYTSDPDALAELSLLLAKQGLDCHHGDTQKSSDN